MTPLSIIEPAAKAAESPPPTMKEGATQEDSALFASLVDVAIPLPKTSVLRVEGGAAPALLASDGPEGDPKDQLSQGDTRHPMVGVPAITPQVATSTPTKDLLADPRQVLPSRPQLDSIPKQVVDQASISPPPTRPAKGEGSSQAAGLALSAAQSMVEGRIAQLPKVAAVQAGVAQGGQTETRPEPKLSKLGEGQLPQTAASVQQPTSKATALPMQILDPVTPRARNLPERGTPATSQTSAPRAPALGSVPIAAAAQPVAAMAQGIDASDAEIKTLDQDGMPGLSGPDRPVATASTVSGVASAGPETARHIAHQIATAIVPGTGKATEILLNPEELGRVRMSMSSVDGNLTLVVLADRPETQELLRRHIDVLAQEFRDLGYDSVSFSFNADGQSGTDGTHDDPHDDTAATMKQTDETVEVATPLHSSGLDLRL